MSTELAIRVGSFLFMLVIMGTVETLWPRRVLDAPKKQRWFTNISVSVLSSLIARVLAPVAPVAAAIYCVENGVGLLNFLPIQPWLAFLTSVLFLDMLIYWQHVLFHKIPSLWLIHRMHHADTNIDASTGIRFHPIEIGMSIFIKLAAILILGPPPEAVITFEVLLNGCALFNHANVKLPLKLDKGLRLLMVTPDMHRVHHSTDMREANMNYGFNFPWWDRIFNTYKSQPDKGHTDMQIGLKIFRDSKFSNLGRMLTIPFI